MALKFTAQAAQPILNRGLYNATLERVEMRPGPNGDFLMWLFSVVADGVEVTIGRPTSTKFTVGSKAHQYVSALTGQQLKPEEEVDLEALYGAPCQVLVTVARLDGSGARVNRIESVLAYTPESQNGGNGDVPF
jgi:hypothetical protein